LAWIRETASILVQQEMPKLMQEKESDGVMDEVLD